MTLRTDIQDVRSRTDITDAEKRALIYDLKGTAIVNLFADKVGQTMVRGIYTMRLDRLPVFHPNRTLEFWVTVTKNGVTQPLNLPIYIRNPPILVPDVTPGTFREDVVQAIRDVLIEEVR